MRVVVLEADEEELQLPEEAPDEEDLPEDAAGLDVAGVPGLTDMLHMVNTLSVFGEKTLIS